MTLLSFLIALIVCGVVFYLVDAYIPMPPAFKTVLRIIAVVVLLFMFLTLFGLFKFPFAIQ